MGGGGAPRIGVGAGADVGIDRRYGCATGAGGGAGGRFAGTWGFTVYGSGLGARWKFAGCEFGL